MRTDRPMPHDPPTPDLSRSRHRHRRTNTNAIVPNTERLSRRRTAEVGRGRSVAFAFCLGFPLAIRISPAFALGLFMPRPVGLPDDETNLRDKDCLGPLRSPAAATTDRWTGTDGSGDGTGEDQRIRSRSFTSSSAFQVLERKPGSINNQFQRTLYFIETGAKTHGTRVNRLTSSGGDHSDTSHWMLSCSKHSKRISMNKWSTTVTVYLTWGS